MQTGSIPGRYLLSGEGGYLFLFCFVHVLDRCVQIPVDWCVHSRISGAPILK